MFHCHTGASFPGHGIESLEVRLAAKRFIAHGEIRPEPDECRKRGRGGLNKLFDISSIILRRRRVNYGITYVCKDVREG